MFNWRDFNHDGKVDKRDYWENFGGSHYFRPGNTFGTDFSYSEQIAVGIVRIIVGILLIVIGMSITI